MKITAVMWGSYSPILKRAAAATDCDLAIFPNRLLEDDPGRMEDALRAMRGSDIVLLYHTTDMFWESLDKQVKEIKKTVPVICLGTDPAFWCLSTVKPEIVATCQTYLTYNGDDNFKNLLLYIRKNVFNEDIEVPVPGLVPWEGLYHPDAAEIFTSTAEYRAWYADAGRESAGPWVGMLFSRVSWASRNCAIEDELIRALENAKINVIPVFTYSLRDDTLGAKGMAQVVRDFLAPNGKPEVDAIVKLVPFLLGTSSDEGHYAGSTAAARGTGLLLELKIPVFSPVISSYKSLGQWRESAGLTLDVGWAVAMPEFEGVIEPVYIGAGSSSPDGEKPREPLPDRCRKVAARVKKWIALAKKPVSERKVAFILNNNPCANADANIGAATHLDTLESVARIISRMKDAGYRVEPPASGKDLIDRILEKKAVSEFRWTNTDDIVAKGGALMQMDTDTYTAWFLTLPPTVRERVNATWGRPPGAGMVHEGKILITGLSLGNATVHVQPKRGCFGARCDGQVCKILHDPDCPPPHQYLATYHWIEDIFGADVIVQVGTHGNLEFLPGKGVGLSEECFPDVVTGDVPFLYVYNADNPPEGTIAKRRGYAVLCDHMQTVLSGSGLYGGLEELENLLGQYETAKNDPARGHALQHLILDAVNAANLDKDMHLSHDLPLADIVGRAHEALSKIQNTQIAIGMHILGEIPDGENRVKFIFSILRFDTGERSLRRAVAGVFGLDLSDLLAHQDRFSETEGLSYGKLLETIDRRSKQFIRAVLSGSKLPADKIFTRPVARDLTQAFGILRTRILDIDHRLSESKEIDSLLTGFDGRYIPSGPSGLVTRGHDEVIPTGRNFYSLDPYRAPTRAAWRVGSRLADTLLAKYEREEGKIPENVAFYWMAGDIMSSDGEMYAEILWLLGVEPVWLSNGQVKAFTIVPLQKLGRPRIDVTVRSSGILRDNFSNCYELVDEAVQAVAALDENPEQNFVRKHTLAAMTTGEKGFREATYRVFSSKPGTYGNGVNLAVLASAWKTEEDLADIFVAWNGYAYGKDSQGSAAHEQLAENLSTVAVTFNKIQSDEYDLLGCCCYFGTQGGMTAAARHYSGNEVKPYYGDTREPDHVEVRDLADEIRRVVRTKLLNPKWIDGMKEHGYKGASDMMKRITHVYGWEASTQEVDDWIFDDIATTFVNNEEMRQFFEENNPYALEEIARRLLEAEQRGLWDADKEVLDNLKNNYLEIESWMEDLATEGGQQGGNVDICTQDDIASWGDSIKDIMTNVHAKHPRL
ncbi:MAG: cobaltochelatase subunit CobN [Methanoregula sp.]|jgi:cobaltochelatase CobN